MSNDSGFSFIEQQLRILRNKGLYRNTESQSNGVDFKSNDYLGLARNSFSGKALYSGSGSSRLISGNYALLEEVEVALASFYHSESALLFPSGYQANLGLFQALAGRNDFILFDELCHASIRDGIRLSFAKAFSFRHNDLDDLKQKAKSASGNVFVVTEGIFSMDGDQANLDEIASFCRSKGFYLILDEAHSAGITGIQGRGLCSGLELNDICIAKMIGLGKAHGCQGGAILGSAQLKELLINKHRGVIYSTGLAPVLAEAVLNSVHRVENSNLEREKLHQNILHFTKVLNRFSQIPFRPLKGPIQTLVIGGNESTVRLARDIQNEGFLVSAIRSPSVAKGTERIRLIIHSYNTFDEIDALLNSVNKNFFAKK
jgi:8-amino-7-oxononanoate synthase